MPQNGRPSPGDMTGQVKAQNAKEQAEVVRQRSAEMSMMDSVQSDAQENGVFDPQSGERLDTPSVIDVGEDDGFDGGDSGFEQGEEQPPQFFGPVNSGYLDDDEPVLTGHEDPKFVEELMTQRPQRRRRGRGNHEVARPAFVTVRVDSDFDKMTYGMTNGEPNNYDLKEGFKYRLPIEVADHLQERGGIRQWIG